MTPKEHRQYLAEQLRGVDREARTVDIVASDNSLDSYGTRIDQGGWDLDQFKKNGPICVQHDSYSRKGLPVAQAIPETVRVENNKLLMTIRFAPAGVDETADRVFELVAAGILKGVSVGFDPMEWKDDEEKLPDGKIISVRTFKRQRLMEVSIVTIPANDNGLIQLRSAKLNQNEDEVRAKTEALEARLKTESEQTQEEEVGGIKVTIRTIDAGTLAEFRSSVEKWSAYFEKKQPVNRAASKAMERFFKVRGLEQPAEELAAFERMDEIIQEEGDKPAEEEVKEVEVKPEEIVEKPEEPTPPTPEPAPEAPAPERKASVHIPITAFHAMPRMMAEAMKTAAAEALRNGYPAGELDQFLDSVGQKLMESLVSPPSR